MCMLLSLVAFMCLFTLLTMDFKFEMSLVHLSIRLLCTKSTSMSDLGTISKELLFPFLLGPHFGASRLNIDFMKTHGVVLPCVLKSPSSSLWSFPSPRPPFSWSRVFFFGLLQSSLVFLLHINSRSPSSRLKVIICPILSLLMFSPIFSFRVSFSIS